MMPCHFLTRFSNKIVNRRVLIKSWHTASQLLAMANGVAAGALSLADLFPTSPAGPIATTALALNLEALSINSAQLTSAIQEGNSDQIIIATAAIFAEFKGHHSVAICCEFYFQVRAAPGD